MTRALQRHREQFDSDPARSLSFEALEEHHFLHGEWEELTSLYERRLEAPALRGRSAERVRLLFRLGQVLEERCGDPARALDRYRQAVEIEPSFVPALRQLRRIYADRGQWELVLQVAEVEGALPMRAYEAAAFHAELGQVWAERMGDAAQALLHFERALEASAGHEAAAAGRAGCLTALGQAEEAAHAWAALLERLSGQDRAPVLVSLAKLLVGPLAQPDRAFEAYRRALTEDPRCRQALEALVVLATDRGQWPMVAELQERRFELATGADERLAIALEAGGLELRLRNPHAARLWYRRARELAPDEARVELALAEVERLAGRRDELVRHLEGAFALDARTLPVQALLELATLAAARGAHEDALARVRLAVEHSPQSEEPAVLAALDGHLARAGRFEERIDVLERRAALAVEPRVRAGLLAELAGLLEGERGALRPAWDAYRRAFDADPSLPGLTVAIERVLAKAEDWEELRAYLAAAVERGPAAERTHAHCALGEVLAERLQDPDGALRAFEAALAAEPGCEPALRGLERVALRQGDGETILRAYEREVAIASEPGRRAFLLGEIVRLLEADDRAEEALMWAEQLAATTPEDSGALATCARLQDLLEDPVGLTGTLEKLDLVCAPGERAGHRRRLAELHRSLDDEERAVTWCRAALESEPGHEATLESLAELLESAGRLAELAEVQRELAEREAPPRRATRLDALARLLADGLGDLEGARATLARLVAEPNPPPDLDERLEALLERMGRTAELAEHLAQRRASLADGDPGSVELDLRRGEILLERLDRAGNAGEVFRRVLAVDPTSERAERGLAAALRAANDLEGLAALLAERAARAADAAARERILLERAMLLEEGLGEIEGARRALVPLADSATDTEVRRNAAQRLEALLERRGDWAALRARLEARLGRGDRGAERELHERLAALVGSRLGDRTGALTHLEAAGGLAPERAEVWRRLAVFYDEDGRHEDLLRVIEAELATRPDAERELRLRSRAALLGREADPDRAEAHYRRVLELSPSQPDAAEFLTARYEVAGRHAELLAVLEPRLAHLASESDAASRLAVRLRIASLLAGPLDDPEGALRRLEPALTDGSELLLVAEPLAALYERTRRTGALVELCRRAAGACELPAERAEWRLCLGAALRASGHDAEAAGAYAEALADRPGDRAATGALCGLYRGLGEAGPLARLLEEELARVGGRDEIPLLRELAELYAGPLGDPGTALVHQRRILELDPEDGASLDRAIELAGSLGQHDLLAALLDAALRRTREPNARADLLAGKGDLLAGALGRPEDAVAVLRAALFAAPRHETARRVLRRVLESLSRWSEVLDLLHVEAAEASGEVCLRMLEEGADLATERLGVDAALPWLERLRTARPEDPTPLARIAAIHREGDRPRARLRALEAELALGPPLARRRDLHAERAEVLEQALGLSNQAVQALEQARACAPEDLHVLRELNRLNSSTGRILERAEILAVLVPLLPPEERNAARRERAWLLAGPLGEPAEAARVIEGALARPEEGAFERTELLRSLSAAYRAARRPEDLSRVAEEELRGLEVEGEACAGRCAELHDELARLYGREVADPARELHHLRAFLDGGAPVPPGDLARVEARLLDRLRATGDTVELARRLSSRLAREARDAEGWLELARLEEERFARPAAGAEAYGRVLAIDPGCLDALRGLRRCAERLGDPEALIQALEGELEHDPSLSPAARGVILRRAGQVARRELGSTTRASRAFARALEVEPGDLASLRALEELFESMEDWRGTLDFYESEVETLGEAEPERRRGVWLRVAELARDRTRDARRALRAFEAAARIEGLEPRDQIAWAELALASGDRERFAELFGRWCDDPRSGARAEDELRLAGALEVLGRASDALVRADRATKLDPQSVQAWDAVAHLRGLAGDAAARADALERAAELLSAAHAVERLCAAAETLAEVDPARALDLLGRAVERDPASVRAHAALALSAAAGGELETASRAAQRALELDGSARDLELAARGLLARTGGRAARARSDLATAVELFEALLDVEPEDPEGLVALGELHVELGQPGAALPLLERRLALATSGEERAHLLVLRARALEATGRLDESLAACEEARGLDPSSRHVLASRARLLERTGRRSEAVEAFELHARSETDPIESARLLTKAAELALGAEALSLRAEGWLQEATRSHPASGAAWLLLARSLAGDERFADALGVADAALASAGGSPESAEIAALRAEALEAVGEHRAAAEAHRDVALRDPSRLANGLASARLYRSLGEWQAGAELLRSLARTRAGDARGRAAVLFELARLLSGPLEDMPGAIDAYRSALAANPGLSEARRALADLLVHCPEHRAEALALHRAILAETPCRVASVRGLVRLAQGRSAAAEATGLTVLRALGAASPDERERASAVVTPAPGSVLEDPLFECARELVRGAAPEIGQALLAASPRLEPTSEDPVARFRTHLLACEAELAAPGLAALGSEELAELVGCLARLAQQTDAPGGDGPLADSLAAALSRRTRRRLARILEERGTPAEAVASIDFESWRAELRALAAAETLRRTGETLRTALLALLTDEPGLRPAPEADLAPLVERAPGARALVRRVVLGGCEALVKSV